MKIIKSFSLLGLILILQFIVGCVSPLKSDDPTVRARALEEIVDDDNALMLIAMDIEVDVGRKMGSYTNFRLVRANYLDDVRVGAVKKIKTIDNLLKCAIWQDGEYYVAPDFEQGRMTYRGVNYYTQERDRLFCMINSGEVVRTEARRRLKSRFRDVCRYLTAVNAQSIDRFGDQRKGIKTIFPSGVPRYGSYGGIDRESSFVDGYGQVRPNNPLDVLLSDFVESLNRQEDVCYFISSIGNNKLNPYPNAVEKAIRKIDGTDDEKFESLLQELVSRKVNQNANIPVMWIWGIYAKINRPTTSLSIQLAKLGCAGTEIVRSNSGNRIIEIAEEKFSSEVWARCYLENIFDGYPKDKVIKNITDVNCLTRILIDARKMGLNDIDYAISKIDDAAVLEKVQKDCYLKVVAEKADARHFNLTYPARYSKIEKITDVVMRGVAALDFKKRLLEAEIEDKNKEELINMTDLWMSMAADAIISESAAISNDRFVLSGFYVGMAEYKARILLSVRYQNEDIKWKTDERGVIERLDFGTTHLAKVYDFPAQTWDSWVDSFGIKHGMQFTGNILKDEKKPIGGRGTIVRVSQPVWRHQNNRANITFTYFGEKKIEEIKPQATGFVADVLTLVRGVTGGDVVKEFMVEGARHWAEKEWEKDVGGYPGTLRIELGTVGPGGTRLIRQPTRKTGIGRHLDSVQDSLEAIKDAAPAVENMLNGLMN